MLNSDCGLREARLSSSRLELRARKIRNKRQRGSHHSAIRIPQSKIGGAADAAVLRAVERRVLAGLLGGLEVEFELRDAARGRLELFGVELFGLARELERRVHAPARCVEGARAQTPVADGLDYSVARGDEVRLVLADENHVGAGLDGPE